MLNTPSAALDTADAGGFWSRTSEQLFAALQSGAHGLSAAEAVRRLARAWRERAGRGTGGESLAPAVAPVREPAGADPGVRRGRLAASLRDWVDAAIILAIVLGSALLGFVQEYRASNAVAELRKRLALTVRVLRDGALQSRRRGAARAGRRDRSCPPATWCLPTACVLQARDFLVTEASLTGESFPVEKAAGRRAPPTRRWPQRTQLRLPGHLGAQRHGHRCWSCTPAAPPRSARSPRASRRARRETEFARGVRQFG